MARLRVLIIVNQLLGWSQNFITRELVTLQDLGVDLRVATRSVDDRMDLTPGEARLARRALGLPENPFLLPILIRHFRFALRNGARYRRAWSRFLAIEHDRFQARIRSLSCLFRAAAVADEVLAFDPDLIHAHFLTAPTETALFLSAICGKPWSATAHAMDIYRDNSGNRSKIADALFVTTCTEANRQFLTQSFPENSSKTVRIYHGLEIPPSNEKHPLLRSSPFEFLAVGRMVAKKGFEYLILACSLVRNRTQIPFRCKMVGDGDLLDAFRERVSREDLEGIVELPGRARVTAMASHYLTASALVVPSVITADGDRDGIPNVCLEAMAHRLPVIASDVSGLPEVVRPGLNGLLVPPADPEALAEAMVAILTHDDPAALGRESLRIVSEKFDVTRNVHTFLQTAESYLRRV
jgi:glycosyltransferase involved in cell wall biosynthesis